LLIGLLWFERYRVYYSKNGERVQLVYCEQSAGQLRYAYHREWWGYWGWIAAGAAATIVFLAGYPWLRGRREGAAGEH
jgi:hypothetical protein